MNYTETGSPKKRKRGDRNVRFSQDSSFLASLSLLDYKKGVNYLPQELLANIFSYLPPQEIPSCSLVCKKWRDATYLEDNLWRRLAISRWPCYSRLKRGYQNWRLFFITNFRRETLAERFPSLIDEIELELAGLELDKIFSCGWIPSMENQMIDSQRLTVQVFHPPSMSFPCNRAIESETYSTQGGIRVVLFHPLNNTVVTSGAVSNHLLLWDASTFLSCTKCPTPLAAFSDHSDWIFSADWLSDNILATAGRDGKVYAWNMDSKDIVERKTEDTARSSYDNIPVFKSISKIVDNGNERRIREIQTDHFRKQFGLLSLSNEEDGDFQVWDVEQKKLIGTVPLSSSRDAVTLAYYPDANVYFVGSHVRLYMVDPRAGRIQRALYFTSNLHASHIRSLVVRYHMLTIGFGTGRIFFYDLRKETESLVRNNHRGLRVSRGWVRQDNQLDTPGPHLIEDYNPAIYCMSYIEDGSNLFVGGGPLQLNLYGSYASFLQVNAARLYQSHRCSLET
eukprot:jgi/Galph1/1979/GphlegSOOS_G635.1